MHIHSHNKYDLISLCSFQYDIHVFWNGILFQLPPDAQYHEESRQMSQPEAFKDVEYHVVAVLIG